MTFTKIDIENWHRKEYYLHYMNQPCTYSLTTTIDITELKNGLKNNNQKIYPALIYMLTTMVNQHEEFRMTKNAKAELGYWKELIPSYTIFNKENQTFSSIWTTYTTSFTDFYAACVQDIATYSDSKTLFPKQPFPTNSLNISILPWTEFTSFSLNIYDEGSYLLPIFTIGKFIQENEKILMPLAIQVNHAVCDGYHLGNFITDLQQFTKNYSDWL